MHSDVEIGFEDRSFGAGPEVINRPFEVAGLCLTRSAAEGTEVVLAYCKEPEYGFYNKGLALTVSRVGSELLGEHAERLAHVGFKVKSRYLEHTLSRDTVVREGNFLKAMALVMSAADGPLQSALVAELGGLTGRPGWSISDLNRYSELIGYLAREPAQGLVRNEELPILRSVDGTAVSLARVWEAASEDRRGFVSDTAGPLEQMLIAAGTPVLWAGRPWDSSRGVGEVVARYVRHRHDRSLRGRLAALGLPVGRSEVPICAPASVFIPVVTITPQTEEARLVAAAAALLATADAGYGRLVACELPDDSALFVLGRTISPMMQRPPQGRLFLAGRPRRPEAAVHCGHPLFRRWVELQRTAPALAAYCVAKDLLLIEDRMLGSDAALMAAARPAEVAHFGGRR